jgi:2,4-dienoyl-CoA reductase (NADPH2)
VLSHLLSPVRIGRLELRNRIAMAPMGVELVEADGMVREPTVRYYEERARGGAGLLITENTSAAYPHGANSAHEIGVSDERFLPGLSALAEAVHRHGAKLAIQLAHHGKIARLDAAQGRPLLMPSEPRFHVSTQGLSELTKEELGLLMRAGTGVIPKVRAATKDDIAWLVEAFASAAERARRAGIDAVELHAAHGYIFSEFLSPGWNFRDDEYGGPLENRARLLCEVIRACKQRAGADFTLWCRIDAHEYGEPRGITLADAKRTAQLAARAGADAIHVSAYAPDNLGHHFTDAPLPHAQGAYVDFAAAIKAVVPVPVIAVGRIEPEQADRLIRDGKADLVSMGRKLLADPELPRKLAEGRAASVRPCIYCYVCVAQAFFDRPVRCAVNPEAGKEAERTPAVRTPAARRKRVLVVGGGPAGMEAARVAALRGHEVVLCEKSALLGGTLRLAALVYEPNERLLRWFEREMREQPVEVRTGQEVTPELVRELAPDVVIAAAGARRVKAAIPGAERPHVFDGDALRALLTGEGGEGASGKLSLVGRLAVRAGRLTGVVDDPGKLREASRAYMPVGRRVAIVGGGLVGAELAEFLAERGREVVVLEEGPVIADGMAHPRRWHVLHELREAGVRLVTRARVVSIDERSVRFEHAAGEGAPLVADAAAADTVIVATGLEANPEPARLLAAAGIPVVEIGDATGVGYLEGAIHSGFRAALDL